MPRNSRIFDNLWKLKIALDVDRDVIDGDFELKKRERPAAEKVVLRSSRVDRRIRDDLIY